MSHPISPQLELHYAALTTGAGLVDASDRTQIELTGADRAEFLHNLCTAHVRELPPGTGCEAFFLNVKGHVIGHGFVFVGSTSHVIDSVPGQAESLLTHLDRYLIREDVQLFDRTAEWGQLWVAGSSAAAAVQRLATRFPPGETLGHLQVEIAGCPVWVRRIDVMTAEDHALAMPRDAIGTVREALLSGGAVECSAEAANVLRIERGTPQFGIDITDDNLPQEVDRNRQAISFTKGCYLGQETVARIDALGHVNRLLRQVKFDGEQVPAPGIVLRAGDKAIGAVTSGCWSPRWNAPLALAYVRRGYHEPGSKLESDLGPAEVMAPSPAG